MRYLYRESVVIDTQSRQVTLDGDILELAPRVFDLLVFFCQNANRVISKDELMDKVWLGSIVTDNAITRTLVKVRKALGDDPKQPQFIVTIPRKGYRMDVNFVHSEYLPENEEKQDEFTQDELTQEARVARASESKSAFSLSSAYVKVAGVTALLALIALLYDNLRLPPTQPVMVGTATIKPLTRTEGEEIYPALSHDTDYLAYTKLTQGKPNEIIFRNLTTNQEQVLAHPRGSLSKLAWAPGDERVAFVYRHNNVCRIFESEKSRVIDAKNWRQVSECHVLSSTSVVYSADGQFLYYSDLTADTSGHQIFRVALASLEKTIVNQPITNGKGNYDFDISPDGKKMVILNSEYRPKTRVYILDLLTTELTLEAELDYLMRSVIWSHDGLSLIHPSPHPAYEIWQSTLQGEKLAVIASSASRSKHIARVNNGRDFVFVSYLLDRNIKAKMNGQDVELNNSSVMDYLPAISKQNDKYAFVSKRNMKSEVFWSTMPNHEPLQDNAINNPSKLIQKINLPLQHTKFYHLSFSPAGEQLAILVDNGLYVATLSESGASSIERMPLDNIAIAGVSWIDEQNLLYSTIRNNRWYVDSINTEALGINTEAMGIRTLPSDYAAAVHDSGISYFIAANGSGQVFAVNQATQTSEALPLTCQPVFKNRKLNLRVTKKKLTCWTDYANRYLSYNLSSGEVSELGFPPHRYDYQATDNAVVYSVMDNAVADIMLIQNEK